MPRHGGGFLKEQALKPCPGPRSRDLQQLAPIESSPNPNLTDLVKKEGRDFHFFSDTRYMVGKTPLLRLRITRRKKGNLKILHFLPFSSMIQLIYINLLFSAWCLRHNRVVQKDRWLATISRKFGAIIKTLFLDPLTEANKIEPITKLTYVLRCLAQRLALGAITMTDGSSDRVWNKQK